MLNASQKPGGTPPHGSGRDRWRLDGERRIKHTETGGRYSETLPIEPPRRTGAGRCPAPGRVILFAPPGAGKTAGVPALAAVQTVNSISAVAEAEPRHPAPPETGRPSRRPHAAFATRSRRILTAPTATRRTASASDTRPTRSPITP
jgi:hypothetical protein